MARPQRWILLLLALKLFALGFLCGGVALYHEWGPGAWLKRQLASEASWDERQAIMAQMSQQPPYEGTKRQARMFGEEPAAEGYTLITSTATGSQAFLVDLQGRVTHRWAMPFSRLWPKAPHVAQPNPDRLIFWPRAQALPDGGLIAVYQAYFDYPYGYGMVKLDKDSRPLWQLAENIYGDFNVDTQGRIYALTQSIRRSERASFPYLHPPIVENGVVVVSAKGEELARVNVLDAFEGSGFEKLITYQSGYQNNLEATGDYLQANSLFLLPEGYDYRLPGVMAGQVLLSLRAQNVLAVMDMNSRKIVWAATGPWRLQNDAEFLPNGNILLFDNQGAFDGKIIGAARRSETKEMRSRVMEYDPVAQTVVWSFDGGKENRLYSADEGMQQILPNGHVLVTESRAARVREVTREGAAVWEYQETYPGLKQRKNNAASILSAWRYLPGQVPFIQSGSKP